MLDTSNVKALATLFFDGDEENTMSGKSFLEVMDALSEIFSVPNDGGACTNDVLSKDYESRKADSVLFSIRDQVLIA